MMIKKLIVLFICAFTAWPFLLKAQVEIFIGDAAGNPPLKTMHYTNVQGSPYFNENWLDGVVKLADGKIYKDVKLKYDQVLDKVFFEGNKGDFMAFNSPVLEFKLSVMPGNEVYFVNGFKPVDGSTDMSFYQKLIYEGNPKIQLLKRTIKKIYESRVYNSAVTNKIVEIIVVYYLADEKKTLKKITLNRKSLIAGIGNRQAELEKYTEENNLNLKKEEDVIKLVLHYNGI